MRVREKDDVAWPQTRQAAPDKASSAASATAAEEALSTRQPETRACAAAWRMFLFGAALSREGDGLWRMLMKCRRGGKSQACLLQQYEQVLPGSPNTSGSKNRARLRAPPQLILAGEDRTTTAAGATVGPLRRMG